MDGMRIRPAGPADHAGCLRVVAALPETFGAEAAERVVTDLAELHSWVADDGEQVLGFVTVQVRSSLVAEIRWAAVLPDLQGYGIGTRLVERAAGELGLNGVALLQVKFDAESPTRQFWDNRGFLRTDVVELADHPGRTAVHVAALARTR